MISTWTSAHLGRLACCLALPVLAACGGTDAPVLDFGKRAEINRIVDAQMQAEGLPSALVGVWIGDEEFISVRGSGNLATGRARTAEEPFRIASITKSFIGTATLILVDRGQLSKADKLSRWYPNFPRADSITVGDLLRMRSGIADSADPAFLVEYWNNPLMTLDAEAMIARAAARGSESGPPDRVTQYTNVNFILLERIVEKVSGTDIRSFLAANILRPLDLRQTSYPSDSQLPGPMRGYGAATPGGALADRTIVNPIPAGGAGAMISTLDDLRRYTRALCRGDLLKPDSQVQRLRASAFVNNPSFVGYGEGVARLGRFCGHNGTIFGFSSEVWYLPEVDATFVVSVNRLDIDDESKSFAIFALVSRLLFPNLVDW